MNIAIVGAGMSGLVCAGKLSACGIEVTVFEKSRGPSGRMATRRTDGGLQFDHGAQYFTARDAQFRTVVDQWLEMGLVAPWDARIAAITAEEVQRKDEQPRRFVGMPRMSAIGRRLAEDLPSIEFQTHVGAIHRRRPGWEITDQDGGSLGSYDTVLVAVPAPQATPLLADAPQIQQVVSSVTMHGCWAAMFAVDEQLGLDFDGAFVNDSILSWVARNSSKPGRSKTPETWILHGSQPWSDETLDQDPDEILPHMLKEFSRVTKLGTFDPVFAACHRWKYAIPQQPLEDRMLYDSKHQIGVCGDWCGGPRVEGAYLSGWQLAEQVIQSQ